MMNVEIGKYKEKASCGNVLSFSGDEQKSRMVLTDSKI
jgi:hypothetical protein